MKARSPLAAVLAGLLLLATVVVGGAQPAHAAEPSWWNASWSHRMGVKVMAADALASGYSVKVTVDHASLVAAGRSIASGNDVRVVRWNGTSWAELDRVLAVGSSWNSASTQLYFRTQTAVGAASTDTSYYLYYGNGAAGAPPANPDNVYDLFDDFNDGTIDAGKWITQTRTGITTTESGGSLRVQGTSANDGSEYTFSGLQSNAGFTSNYTVESTFQVNSASPAAAYWFKAMLGNFETKSAVVGPGHGGPGSQFSWWNTSNSTFASLGSSGIGGAGSPIRVRQSISSAGLVQHYEDDVMKGSRAGSTTANFPAYFNYSAGVSNSAFDVRFDDVIVRKFVSNEPNTVLENTQTVSVSANVDPSLTFTVAGRASGCGGETPSPGASSSGTSANLGSISASSAATAMQDMYASTNGAGGYVVYGRYSQPLTAAPGQTIADLSATGWADAAAFPALGTAAFGTRASWWPAGTWARVHAVNQDYYMSSPGPASNNWTCVAYRAQAGPTTPAGTYSTTVTYTIVAHY